MSTIEYRPSMLSPYRIIGAVEPEHEAQGEDYNLYVVEFGRVVPAIDTGVQSDTDVSRSVLVSAVSFGHRG